MIDAARSAWLKHGAECFDRGEFWEAHEHWETIWRAYPGHDRDYLKGLIQLAAVNYHLVRGNRRAARRLLDSGVRHLQDSDPLAWPFDTGHLLVVAAALAAKLDAGHALRPVDLRLAAMLEQSDLAMPPMRPREGEPHHP